MSTPIDLDASDLKALAASLEILSDLRINQGVEPGAGNEIPRISYGDLTFTLKMDAEGVKYILDRVRHD